MKLNRLIKASSLALMAALYVTGCSAGTASSETKTESADSKASSQQAVKNTEVKSSSESDSADEKKDDEITLDGEVKASSNQVDLSSVNGPLLIDQAGTWTLSGKTSHPVVIEAKGADVTVKLENADIETEGLPAIYVRKAGSVTVEASGGNILKSSGNLKYEELNAAVYSKADLVMKGSGSLEISADNGHGIKAKDTFEASDLSMVISASQDGIHINEDGTFNSGSYTINAEDEGIQSEQSLLFKNGSYNVMSTGGGLRAEDSLIVEDGTYLIDTENEGIESKNTLEIKNGTITIDAVDDGINAANSLVIQNGTATCISRNNDGIDSNGDLIVNGGTVTAVGLKTPELSFDTDGTPFEINGGTVVGLGTAGSIPTAAKQNYIVMQTSEKVQSVRIEQDGNSVLEWSSDQLPAGQSNSTVLLLSSEKLEVGKQAIVYINGQQAETMDVTEGSNIIGNIQTGPGGRGGFGPGEGGKPGSFGDDGSGRMRPGRRN